MMFKKGKTLPKPSETLIWGIALIFVGSLFLFGTIVSIDWRGYVIWFDYCLIGVSLILLFFGILALNLHRKGYTQFEK